VSWRTAKALLALRDQVNAAVPGRNKRSDGTIGDANHQNRNSDHNPWVPPPHGGVVTALDLTHDPAAGADMNALAEALRASRDTRIKYVIWNRRIFTSYAVGSRGAWQWGAYSGSNPHTSHIHVSVNSAASHYDNERTWALPSNWRAIIRRPEEDAAVEALVRGMQESLAAAGYDPGPIDGRWGPRTQAALTSSLRAQGKEGPRGPQGVPGKDGGGQFSQAEADFLAGTAQALLKIEAQPTSVRNILLRHRHSQAFFVGNQP